MKDNIVDFAPRYKRKEIEESRFIEADAIDDLNVAFSNLVTVLMYFGEHRNEDQPINPWLLVDGFDSIMTAIGEDPRKNEEWMVMREICDRISAEVETT
jgi:hypothetical protein